MLNVRKQDQALSLGKQPRIKPTKAPNRAPDQGLEEAPQVLPAH